MEIILQTLGNAIKTIDCPANISEGLRFPDCLIYYSRPISSVWLQPQHADGYFPRLGDMSRVAVLYSRGPCGSGRLRSGNIQSLVNSRHWVSTYSRLFAALLNSKPLRFFVVFRNISSVKSHLKFRYSMCLVLIVMVTRRQWPI